MNRRRLIFRLCATTAFVMAVFTALCVARTRCGVALPAYVDMALNEPEIKSIPLETDELAALRWLDYVTGSLPKTEEVEWWGSASERQFGLFARRYNIAFAGYAAAALGMRGNAAEKATVGRILGNCIERMLRRDVWAYSQSKNYWGAKPWAPDPCYRENVMYTGHLLQLLALYECFTGDRGYWEKGFDFVWKDGRHVHYDVKRLIDITEDQMRTNPSGGITCEPNLLFFPCNNHPHIALSLFSKLGYGDWTADARRWEQWSVKHFFSPVFGGGALNIVQHVKSGIMYPRGHNGLDAWSLLWYEPWATDRRTAIALWKECASRIDWEMLSKEPDSRMMCANCCDPANVPPITIVSFLAAAARACGDAKTAIRLEHIADQSLVRKGGMLYFDVGREWRIGATANRIIALAIANGSTFRAFLRH
jgi:hypothetical protein